jgi:hypothetical protein
MKESQRTDPHRPGAIIPTDYEYLQSYETHVPMGGQYQSAPGLPVQYFTYYGTFRAECGGERESMRGPHSGDRCCVARIRETNTFSSLGSIKNCSICKAYFHAGDVWRHKPTGECIFVGHTCADKYQMFAQRSEWEGWHRDQKKARAVAIKAQLHAKARREAEAQRDEYLAANPDVAADLALAHPILSSMRDRLTGNRGDRFRALSDKQLVLARKIAAEVRNPKPAEVHVPAPEGRVAFRGTVVSIKEQEGDFGVTMKLVVKVTTPEGSWLVWVTRPTSSMAHKGDTVEIRATLTRGRDAHFAFGKRPTLISEDVAPAKA